MFKYVALQTKSAARGTIPWPTYTTTKNAKKKRFPTMLGKLKPTGNPFWVQI